MKICPKCGAENKFDGAVFCRECGAELGKTDPFAVGPNQLDDNSLENDTHDETQQIESMNQGDITPLESGSDSDSGISDPLADQDTNQLDSFDEPILSSNRDETGNDEIDMGTEKTDETDSPADPINRPSDGAEAFIAKAEIELPGDDSDETTPEVSHRGFERIQKPEETEPEKTGPVEETEAVESAEKDKLIESLHSKIPSLSNKSEDSDKQQTPHSHSLKPGSIIGSTPADELEEPKTDSLAHLSGDSNTDIPDDEPESGWKQPASRYTAPGDHAPRSKGTAFFRKSRIKVPKDISLKSGDEIVVNGRPFTLKPGGRDLTTTLLYGTFVVVLLLLVISQTVKRSGGTADTAVIGVVTDENSGRVLADVEVTINELGRTVTTNDAGMFVFDLLPEGNYSITARTPFYKTAGVMFNHDATTRSIVSLGMQETTLASTGSNETKKTESTKKKTPEYGDLKVITNVKTSEIFLDNRSYGKGSRTIKSVYPGNHKLVIKAEGHETYEKTVRVRENSMTTIDAQLAKIEEDKPVQPTPEQYVAAGQSAFESGDYRKAVESYTLALLKQKNPDWYYMRGQAYLKGNRPADAKKDFIQAGKIYMSEGKATSAISAYTGALDLDSENMTVLRLRGYAYIKNGKYDPAMEDFEKACDIDDDIYENLVGRGDAYSAMGEYKDAIKYYKKAEKKTDDKANVYAMIALANLARGDEGDARKYYEKFIEAATPEIERKYAVDPEWQRLKQIASKD